MTGVRTTVVEQDAQHQRPFREPGHEPERP